MDQPRAALWQEVIERLGLQLTPDTGRAVFLQAEVQGLRVQLQWDGWGDDPPGVTLCVHGSAELAVQCVPARRAPRVRPVLTGDSGFDDAVCVLPGPRDCRPWLDAKTRALLVSLVAAGVSVRGRRLTIEPADTARLRDADAAVRTVGELADLARRLQRRMELPELLERVVDVAPGVREAALQALQERVVRLATPTEVRRLCEAVPDGRDPLRVELLMRAAQAGCPDQGRLLRHLSVVAPQDPRVVDLLARAAGPVESLADSILALHVLGVDVTAAVQAHASDQAFAYALGHRLGQPEQTLGAPGPIAGGARLASLLDARTPATQVAVIRVLSLYDRPEDDQRFAQYLARGVLEARQEAARSLCGVAIRLLDRGGAVDRLDAIVDVARASSALLDALMDGVPARHAHWLAALEPARDDRLLALVHRLGRLPEDPARPTAGLEGLLVPLLEHPTEQVRFAAVDALGAVGSIAAVEPLRRRGGGFRAFGELKLQRAIEGAVTRIQDRANREAAGGLSVTEGARGRLSAVDGAGGLSGVEADEPDPT